jgi:hypothetical protein
MVVSHAAQHPTRVMNEAPEISPLITVLFGVVGTITGLTLSGILMILGASWLLAAGVCLASGSVGYVLGRVTCSEPTWDQPAALLTRARSAPPWAKTIGAILVVALAAASAIGTDFSTASDVLIFTAAVGAAAVAFGRTGASVAILGATAGVNCLAAPPLYLPSFEAPGLELTSLFFIGALAVAVEVGLFCAVLPQKDGQSTNRSGR